MSLNMVLRKHTFLMGHIIAACGVAQSAVIRIKNISHLETLIEDYLEPAFTFRVFINRFGE